MAYPADLKRKAIQLVLTRKPLVRVPGSPVLSQHSSDVTVSVYSYSPSRPGMGGAPAVPAKFTNTNMPWSINFLEYVPGDTTTTRLERPVLTGPMSGCYLFKYVVGGPRIAHVGTDDSGSSSVGSLNAKNNWKLYVTQSNASSVVGVSPALCFSFSACAKAQAGLGGRAAQIYGLFEPGGDSWALLMVPLSADTKIPNLYLVQEIEKMHPQTWSSIEAMRTWKNTEPEPLKAE